MRGRAFIGALALITAFYVYDGVGPYIGIPGWGFGVDYTALLLVLAISVTLLFQKSSISLKLIVVGNLLANFVGFILVILTYIIGISSPSWGYAVDFLLIITTLTSSAAITVLGIIGKKRFVIGLSVLLALAGYTAWGPYWGLPNVGFGGLDFISIIAAIMAGIMFIIHVFQCHISQTERNERVFKSGAFTLIGVSLGLSMLAYWNIGFAPVCIPTLFRPIRMEHFNWGLIAMMSGAAIIDNVPALEFIGWGLFWFGVMVLGDDTYWHYIKNIDPFSYWTGCLIKIAVQASRIVLQAHFGVII